MIGRYSDKDFSNGLPKPTVLQSELQFKDNCWIAFSIVTVFFDLSDSYFEF